MKTIISRARVSAPRKMLIPEKLIVVAACLLVAAVALAFVKKLFL